MRVRLVLAHLTRGGPVEHTLYLAREMAAEGFDVAAVCADDAVAARFGSAGVDSAVIPLRHSLDIAGARRISEYVEGADVVHAQDRRSGLWVRLGPRPRPDGARVYTVHGLPDEYLPPPAGLTRPGLRATLAYRGVDAALCRRADAVIAPSHGLASALAERLRFPPAKLAVIPGGVDPPPSTRGSGDGGLVGTLTMLEPVKGLDVLLKASARLAASRQGLRFGLFGSGPAEAELRALAESLGIEDRVSFPGHVPQAQALERLSVFVLSSWWENCPVALLEAMAAGVPAIATDVGGVPEIAAEAVELVPPGDDAALAAAIARLLDDEALRERRARAGRERVLSRFTAKRMARDTIALYERLLGSG